MDDLAFARTIYFETMRWMIERLFGWDERREQEKFASQFNVAASQIVVADNQNRFLQITAAYSDAIFPRSATAGEPAIHPA